MARNQLGEEIIFSEDTAAARSLKSSWTRTASTYDCIQVVLSREHLIVKPRKLPGVLIRILLFDLNHVIPNHKITSVEKIGDELGYGRIRVEFSTDHGDHPGVELYLKNADAFLDQIQVVIRR